MKKTPQTGNRLNPFVMLAVGLAFGLVLGYLGRPIVTPARPTIETSGPPQATKETSPEPTGGLPFSVRHFKGEAGAPVTIVEFSDFQCSFWGWFIFAPKLVYTLS